MDGRAAMRALVVAALVAGASGGPRAAGAVALHDEGWASAEIAEELGCSQRRVQQILREAGLAPTSLHVHPATSTAISSSSTLMALERSDVATVRRLHNYAGLASCNSIFCLFFRFSQGEVFVLSGLNLQLAKRWLC